MAKRKKEKELVVDLHGMTEYEADSYLTEILNFLDDDIDVIRVIHGYHGGKILFNLVRNSYYHYKIDYILPVFANDGETLYYIKKE